MSVTVISLNRFQGAMNRFAEDVYRALTFKLADRVQREVYDAVRREAPVDSGDFKQSIRRTVENGRRRVVFESSLPDSRAYPKTAVLDRGRRRLKTGRMGGSLQARRGVARPVVRETRRRWRQFADGTVGRLFQ